MSKEATRGVRPTANELNAQEVLDSILNPRAAAPSCTCSLGNSRANLHAHGGVTARCERREWWIEQVLSPFEGLTFEARCLVVGGLGQEIFGRSFLWTLELGPPNEGSQTWHARYRYVAETNGSLIMRTGLGKSVCDALTDLFVIFEREVREVREARVAGCVEAT